MGRFFVLGGWEDPDTMGCLLQKVNYWEDSEVPEGPAGRPLGTDQKLLDGMDFCFWRSPKRIEEIDML